MLCSKAMRLATWHSLAQLLAGGNATTDSKSGEVVVGAEQVMRVAVFKPYMGVASCLTQMSMKLSCGSCHFVLAAPSTHAKACLPCALLDLPIWTNGLTSLACTRMCTSVPLCTAASAPWPVFDGYGLTPQMLSVMHAAA